MASLSRASPSKRTLESAGHDGEGVSEEKRPRIVSNISEVSEQDDLESNVKEQSEGNSPTVVIYELSSDNDESLLNASEKGSEESPVDANIEGKQGSAQGSDVEMKSESDDESDEHDSEEEDGTTAKELLETKERKESLSSVDEVDSTSKEAPQEKRKRLESSDYITKTMEDLEDLQEDLHKELAEITEKSLQKRKHKKASSSSSREKRNKEKTSSKRREKDGREGDGRGRQKERTKEREKQRSTESRGEFKREVTIGVRRDYEKGRKYHEDDDKPWSYDSRRARSEKDERKDRGERHWMQTRLERSPNRTEVKSVVERKVHKESKVPREEESRGKETKASTKSGQKDTRPGQMPKDTRTEQKETRSNQSSKDTNQLSKDSRQKSKETVKEPVKKGIMSDSMRELVRQSIKENKGFAQEVVEEESDESPEHFFQVQTSDVSSASESEEEPVEEESEEEPEVPKLPPYLPAIQGCRSVEEFQWLNRIEEGTYGVVYRAKDKRTGEVVALKKLKMEKEKEGFPITSLREINTLLKAQHPNIVTVQEIVVGNNMDKIYIVMDFVEHDLKALMETMTQSFLAGEIKTIMIQLLRAVNHLHDNWILHRDIKTSNLLLSNKGILKVGDFGLAREYGSPLKPYTPIVVTLWYRAPELLLGAKEYSTPIDIWSVGCVFGELLTMKPLFNGQSEISQINKIFKELGTPSDKIWPGPPAYSELPATKKMTFAEHPYNNLRNKFGATLTDKGFDLLNGFLTYDPSRRITAENALKHEYFKEAPSPVDPKLFPSWPARSEGAKRAKKASPKAPEGGNFYKSLSEDGDGAFHIPAGKSQGKIAVPGFTLKF